MSVPAQRSHVQRERGARTWLIGLLVALAVVAAAAVLASERPDGLEKVAEDEGFLDSAREHDLASSPVAEYEVDGFDDGAVSTALAGFVGVAITLALGAALFRVAKGRRDDTAPEG